MGGKYGLADTSRLEQTEAKQNGIAHTAPDRTGYVVGGSDLLDQQVNLKLWVKVKKDWRDSDTLMKNFGYNKKEI